MNTCKTCQTESRRTLNALQNEGGFALITVLGILLLVTLLALGSFGTSDTDRAIASNNAHNNQAFYAAEAGINRAFGMLYDSTWRAGFDNASLGNARYSVQVIDSFFQPGLKDSLILRAIGTADGSQSVIEVLMAKKRSQVFRRAVYGDSAVDIVGNALVDAYNSDSGAYTPGGMGGNVGSDGLIRVGGDATIYGDVSTADTIITNGSMTIYGTADNSASTVNLEPITQADLDFAKWNSDVSTEMTLSGGATYNSGTYALAASGSTAKITLESGIYYFSSISLTSGAKLVIPEDDKVVIFMTGSLNAAGGTIANTSAKPANLQIYSTGLTVDITGSATIYAAIYAPNAEIKVSGSGVVYGSLVGKSVKDAGNGTVHFDRALLKLESPLKAKYKAVAWQVL
ncbi:MAG TPA: PilX N-terminal domain-containing pilus assembly protein [Verrucomicrobiae bacterium]|nr:PilX N-terminal domain-containing pilus assembly protein [Verrucomicrobiae bacterium]